MTTGGGPSRLGAARHTAVVGSTETALRGEPSKLQIRFSRAGLFRSGGSISRWVSILVALLIFGEDQTHQDTKTQDSCRSHTW